MPTTTHSSEHAPHFQGERRRLKIHASKHLVTGIVAIGSGRMLFGPLLLQNTSVRKCLERGAVHRPVTTYTPG